MKARVKATHEVVEINDYDTDKEGNLYYYTEDYHKYHESEVELLFIKDYDYWTRLEHTYAGMVMQGMLSNEYTHKLYLDNKNYPNGLLNDSIKIAHALVEKMKEADR